ncbi:MAG: hypothetical protein ACREU5_06945 [Burkholderiales bacterium]
MAVDPRELGEVAKRIHAAPSRALRAALREHSDGDDRSQRRLVAVMAAEIVALQHACVDAAMALFDALGMPDVAQGVDDGRDELVDVMNAARVSRRICTGCGCTEFNACPGGCSWATEELCSRCAARPRKRKSG